MNATVLAALIAAGSAVVVAVISNWDKMHKPKVPSPNSPLKGEADNGANDERTNLSDHWSSKMARPKEVVQLMLRSAGHAVFVDGFIGPQTTAAIIEFQRENNLSVSGLIDAPTERGLVAAREKFKAVQNMLIKAGFPVGVDGLCGNNSTIALKDFQSKHGLPISGLPDEATRRLLQRITIPT
ncbi:peptidoglycan-binding domain-containing protein [Sphingomonas sp. RT2P30]|uniref:peptidoglycan-binding domain-containing protein n=1 Tax=Parasphingomonas halimpatiens TaxID=3096162 RepID=UPI002FC7FEE9